MQPVEELQPIPCLYPERTFMLRERILQNRFFGKTEWLALPNSGNYGRTSSVQVSGSDVYLAGDENIGLNSGGICQIWKNGTAIPLTTGATSASAYSVFVAGADVYAAGFENNGTFNVAKIWKNGIATNLTNGTKNARAQSVVVSGPDVYVAGYELYRFRDVDNNLEKSCGNSIN